MLDGSVSSVGICTALGLGCLIKNHFFDRRNTNAARPWMGLLDGSVSSVENSQFWSECLRTISLIDGTLSQQGPNWVSELMVLSARLEHSFWLGCLRPISLIDGTLTQQGLEWVCLMVLSARLEYSQLLIRMFTIKPLNFRRSIEQQRSPPPPPPPWPKESTGSNRSCL